MAPHLPDAETDPPAPEPGVTLCLSGGGYRAAIFHLGALRWLNQQGVLQRVEMVSAVSGGSIVAGHLAHRFRDGWPQGPLSDDEWTERVVEPFWAVVRRDIRTWPVLVRILWPHNWFRSWSTVEAMRRQYERRLFGARPFALTDLPARPKIVFCATDMVFGINWEASAEHVGSYEAGYKCPPPPSWDVARAIAASSCFPPIFPPAKSRIAARDLPRGAYRGPDRDRRVDGMRLTDGGVYDNLALQPAFFKKRVLVSNGGGRLDFVMLNLPWRRLARYPALLQHGIGKLRRSWLMRDLNAEPPVKEGCYWGIADTWRTGPLADDEFTAAAIAGVRTDLNGFTRAEFEILQNHGYMLAAQQTGRCAPRLLDDPVKTPSVPYPAWLDRCAVLRALRHSRKRFWPRRLR